MDNPSGVAAFWYYTLPNYLLAALMYSLIARFLLAFFLPADSGNYIFRFFVRIADPVLRCVGFLTPRAIPVPVLPVFAVVWILMLRFVFFLIATAAGIAPTMRG